MNTTRYEKGIARLQELDSRPGILAAVEKISPNLARHIAEFAYGDVHCGAGLSARDRELAIISGLCALGFAPVELKSHIRKALNTGLSREEVLEVFLQLAVYAGFPAAINASFAAKEVFDERDEAGIKP